MALSKQQRYALGGLLLGGTAVMLWWLLQPRPQENYVIESSLKPDTYIATRVEAETSGEPEPATGVVNGFGVVTHPDGSVYLGNFLAGQAHGNGKITYPGGASFEGEFSEGLPHGKGVCTYSSGKSEDCIFMLGQRQ
jgi:hypothetical protein